MESFFGTDGIRGVYGKTLSPRLFYAVGKALAHSKQGCKIVIGKDPRPSGEVLESAFLAGFFARGGFAGKLGVAPTPAVSYLTPYYGADYGVVIGASHNSPEYNGIKIFSAEGRKLTNAQEQKLDAQIYKELRKKTARKTGGSFRVSVAPYRAFLSEGAFLQGLKIALDTANGSTSDFAARAFRSRGATVFTANRWGMGKRINFRSGATYPSFISNFTRKQGADLGFAFDGDGDRVVVCDRFGNIYDGDDLLYIFARENKYDRVVGTVLTNAGVERALKEKGTIVFRAPVGDRNVAKVMRETVAPFGAEGAGHVLFSAIPSGDGIYTALRFAELFHVRGGSLFRRGEYCKMPTAMKNVGLPREYQTVEDAVKREVQKDPSLRIVVRPSGTEPLLRLYVEGESALACENCLERIVSAIKG
ncbi:MAG: phosphoglucosamine mutase [Clostridia bacterium]|nr:phosphoglucosamine mutase [Clostridia bacterium]